VPTPATQSRRALNRATLSRQLLLERSPLRPHDALHTLAGLQAQAPLAPHVGLWTRLRDYVPATLDELYDERRVLRANLMRATVHLVTTEDALHWQGLLAPIGARSVQAAFGKRLGGIDLDALTGTAQRLLHAGALSTAELGQQLVGHFPGYDADALAYGARGRLGLVHVPPRGKWNASAPTRQTTFAAYLDREPEPAAAPDAMFLRYLAAFGPASVQDAQAWSGLTRLSEIAERLLPELLVLRDEDGRTLYDLPHAARPSEFVPAPIRFLPEYDNVFFGYADRTRFVPDQRKPPIPPGNGARTGTVFTDGEWRATWRIALPAARRAAKTAGMRQAEAQQVAAQQAEAQRSEAQQPAPSATAVLTVTPFQKLTAAEESAIEQEGDQLARFIAGPDLPVRVQIST
jgi:hypothetical protein